MIHHHLFQPLLYQVATAGLAAPDIAAPIRKILRGQDNVTFVHRVRFSFGYHTYRFHGVSNAEPTPPSVVAVLVSKDGSEHVVYTSQVLSGCMEPGLPACTDNMVSVNTLVSGFASPTFHVRLRIESNDFAVELTGVNGHPVQVEVNVCKGLRPSMPPHTRR